MDGPILISLRKARPQNYSRTPAFGPFRRSRVTLRLRMAGKTKPRRFHRSEPSAKNDSGEYATFENALKKILKVPRVEMQERLKRASASRASSAKD